MDIQILYDFVDNMDAKRFVEIHQATFFGFFLEEPDDLDNYKQQYSLGDLEELYYAIGAVELTCEKYHEYLATLSDEDKVYFFNGDFTLEEINGEIDCNYVSDEAHDHFMDIFCCYPDCTHGFDVFMYEIHKEFIKYSISQRDRKIDEILED